MATGYTVKAPPTLRVQGEKPDPTEPHTEWLRVCEIFATGKGERTASRQWLPGAEWVTQGELAINVREGAELRRVGTTRGRRQQGKKNKDRALRCPKATGLANGSQWELPEGEVERREEAQNPDEESKGKISQRC